MLPAPGCASDGLCQHRGLQLPAIVAAHLVFILNKSTQLVVNWALRRFSFSLLLETGMNYSDLDEMLVVGSAVSAASEAKVSQHKKSPSIRLPTGFGSGSGWTWLPAH